MSDNFYLGTGGIMCHFCNTYKMAVTYRMYPDKGMDCICTDCLKKENEKMSDGAKDAFKFMAAGQPVETKFQLKEGMKFDNGKPTTALLPSKPLLEIAKVLDYGAKKYDSHNWRKGINYSRVLSAAQRHLMAWNDGENTDKETNISHLAHAACNILFLLEYELSGKVEFDDRHDKGDKS